MPVHISEPPRNEADEESRNELLRLSNSSVASSALSSMLSKMSIDADALSSRGLDLSLHRQSSELDGFDIDVMSDSILGTALEDPLKELTALDTILHGLSSEVQESHRTLVEMATLPTDSTGGTGTTTTATTAISAARDDVSLTSSSSSSSDGDEYEYM